MSFKDVRILVVGAGFYGSVIAEQIATNLDQKVTVIDSRSHIGGNSHSQIDPETGIEYHTYGSHIFHTSSKEVWDYVNRFSKFNNYRHRVLTRCKHKTYSMPINLMTINRFFNLDLNPSEARNYLDKKIAESHIVNPQNLEEKAISLIGIELYEAFIKGYTQKQWETPLTDLPAEIITRLPFRTSYDDHYFSDTFEGIPLDGYGAMFQKILSHPNIEVRLGVNYFDIKEQMQPECLVFYTGPIDRYFEYSQGRLNWRTTDFEVQRLPVADYQGTSVMNYADLDVPYTRIHEFKHYHPERKISEAKTFIFREYSRFSNDSDVPYYPVNSVDDKKVLATYNELASREKNVVFGGRLGTYTYVDMHQAIAMAMNCYNKIKHRITRV